jgi:hypothetical protein
VPTEAYAAARPYLLHHVEQCLLAFGGIHDVRCEPLHVVYDPDADMVVVTEPDLTAHLDGGGGVWRETKTSDRVPTDVIDALHSHPGFALDVALLAAGAGGGRDVGGAELEVLSDHQAALYFVPLDDGILVSTAPPEVASTGPPEFDDTSSRACRSAEAPGGPSVLTRGSCRPQPHECRETSSGRADPAPTVGLPRSGRAPRTRRRGRGRR